MPRCECSCGAKYKLPDSAVGKKAKCKKCGEVFVVESDEIGIAPLDDGPNMMDEFAAAAGKAATKRKAMEKEVQARADADVRIPSTAIDYDRAKDAVAAGAPPAAKGYFEAMMWAFLFPTNLGNMITFCLIWLLLFVGEFIGAWMCGLVQMIALAYFVAFLFNTIANAASGEEDLPAFTAANGLAEDLVLPFLRYLGTNIIAWLPAFIATIAFQCPDVWSALWNDPLSLQSPSGEAQIVILLWVMGTFLWPMFALCVELGGFGALLRMDLIFVSIVRAFPPYLLTAVLVFAGWVSLLFTNELLKEAGISETVTRVIISVGVYGYLNIVAMQAIGLFYHHFKSRFAWDWG